MSDNTLLIIDGNSMAHRAFHAIPLLSTTEGLVTNAVYGFTVMLLKIIAEQQPSHIAVMFDWGKVTFRHDAFREYKGHRPATPPELRTQFPILKDVLQAMRIPFFEMEGYEADDLIGTLVEKAEKKGLKTIVLTGDRDALQLVSPSTKVLLSKKGISEIEIYDVDKIQKKYGLNPKQLTDLKGLMGDASDNIPGIPGIGERTATKLLQQFGTLEELIAKADELPPRWREKITAFGEQALLSKRLATILRDVPAEINLDECIWPGPDYPRLLSLFSKLEFKSLIRSIIAQEDEGTGTSKKGRRQLKALSGLATPELEKYEVSYRVVKKEDIEELIASIHKAKRAALVLKKNVEQSGLSAALAFDSKEAFLFPSVEPPLTSTLAEICTSPDLEILCHDAKSNIHILRSLGIELNRLSFDTMVAAYLINPSTSNPELIDLTLKHLKTVLPAEGEGALPARAVSILKITEILADRLKEQQMEKLYYEVELPLISVLADMEAAGMAVDSEMLEAMSRELKVQIDALTQEIYRLAGEEFNINSTKQLGSILFEKLGLPVIKRTKTGYSTDAEVLEELALAHEIVAKILEYRQLVKLKSTYIDGLKGLINKDTGCLHTTFHQTVTATGRLSSAEPNLQNIPIRLEQGRKIRKVFIPRSKNNVILAADYSQIELRILAHMAKDPALLEAFQRGEDIHARTAAEVFGVPVTEVTPEMRGKAKAVNFGIVYGISDYGLARDIKVSRKEARRYIDSYFNRYVGVKNFIERTVAQARECGYVTTLLNRRRYLPELFSSNRTVRAFGERAAVNTPIQGSAADIIKLAMVRIHREIKNRGLKTQMILQVHDELIFDVPQDEISEVAKMVKEMMENAIPLDVPLVVDVKTGPNWYDVKRVQELS